MYKSLLTAGILFLGTITVYGNSFNAMITTAMTSSITVTKGLNDSETDCTEIPTITINSKNPNKSADGTENFRPTALSTPATHLNFSGVSEYVELPNENLFDFTDQMTVEFWMNSSTTPSQWDALVAKGDDSWRIALNSTGTLNFAGNGAFGNVNSTTNVIDGNWHHIAVTYDNVNAVIYVDGVLDNSVAGTGAINNSAFKVSIGENLQAQGRNYTGNIDEVRIWNIGAYC